MFTCVKFNRKQLPLMCCEQVKHDFAITLLCYKKLRQKPLISHNDDLFIESLLMIDYDNYNCAVDSKDDILNKLKQMLFIRKTFYSFRTG